MPGTIAIALAAVWTAFVAETIVESARLYGGSIQFVGRTLLSPGIRPGIFILCGLAVSAGLAWAAAVAYARGRPLFLL
jgi:predicted branched-subunit amino acid permease